MLDSRKKRRFLRFFFKEIGEDVNVGFRSYRLALFEVKDNYFLVKNIKICCLDFSCRARCRRTPSLVDNITRVII